MEDKVLIKLLKAFSYQEKCTAVNIKFDLPKVQETELGVHCLVPVGLLAVLPGTRALGVSLSSFCLHRDRDNRKKKLQSFQCGETKAQEKLQFTMKKHRHSTSKISYTE